MDENCEIKFEKISTGNGFSNDLIATANNRIEKAVIEICKLKNTIVSLDRENKKLQNRVFWLTCIGTTLAVLQIVQVLDIIIKWVK